jgi:hypothetical protein
LGKHVYQVQKTGYEFGVELCRREGLDYRYVGFLDADMFPCDDYYERLVKIMEASPRMGIVSGGVYVRNEEGQLIQENCPVQWPWGGARLMRRRCIEEVGGVMTVNSADAVSAIKAMKLGYSVRHFGEVEVIQARQTSSATGLRKGHFQKGIDDYCLGYSLPYVCAKGIYRNWPVSFPLFLYYLAGYLSSLIRRRERIDDPAVREFCRWRLLRRILSRDLPPHTGLWPNTIRSQ